MRGCHLNWIVTVGLLVMLAWPVRAVEREQELADEHLLQDAGLSTDGPALLHFFLTRTQGVADQNEITALIGQLGNEARATRDRATAELIARGPVAIPLLRQCARDPDQREPAARARLCLQMIEGDGGAAVSAAVARLLGRRRPEGTAEVLLAYLPYAEDETVIRECQAALGAVAMQDGKPGSVLLRALEDTIALRRAVAAEVLIAQGGAAQWATSRRLLKDPKPMVRLRVAVALSGVHDGEAIPVLIALLGELPPEQGKQVEEHLIQLAGEKAPKVPLGTDLPARQKCRDAWAAWWTSNEGQPLLEEFRKRTVREGDRDRLVGLIQQLGDPQFKNREKASSDIIALGRVALPMLRQALRSSDAEVSTRAQKCLNQIDKGAISELPTIAARLVAFRKPEGAPEVLLAYLPYAEDDAAGMEVQSALAALAFRDGKPDPVLLRALNDKQPLVRAAAAEALCRAGGPEERQAVRKLLTDAEPSVRLRVGLALAGAADRDAVPVLIALLAQLPVEQAWEAEDFLLRMAGEQPPQATLGSDEAARQKCRDAWAAWWRDHGSKVTLARLDQSQRLLGYTMIVMQDNNGTGRIVELSPGGTKRWQIDGLQYSVDAHILPGNRVLIAEYNANRVTERDFKGNIIWQKQVNNSPVNVQRLRNGNTFIAVHHQLLEVDSTGKEIRVVQRPQHDIMAAVKMRNEQIVCLTSEGRCITMDAAGKELKSFPVGNANYTSGIDVTPNGRILVAQYNTNKVVEYDPDGKVVWEATTQRPTSATRLPNGNTLVASNNSQQIVELNRMGKVVWEQKLDARAWRARRR